MPTIGRPELELFQIFTSIVFYFFGILGAIVAFIALTVNRQTQREGNARRAYLDYAALCIQNPEYAFPQLININLDTQTINGSRADFEKYEWFVSIVIATVRFFLESSDRRWRPIMLLQLAYHWGYLERFRSEKEYLKEWSKLQRKEFDEAIEFGKHRFPRITDST